MPGPRRPGVKRCLASPQARPSEKEQLAAMILIGTMNITRTRGEGDFHCPTCGAFRHYQLKSRRPFLTLYFIPTVPIGGTQYFVRCTHCKSHWDPAILGPEGAALGGAAQHILQEQQFGDDAFRATVLVMMEGGEVFKDQADTLIRISGRLLPNPVSHETLGELVSSARRSGINAANYVRSVCPNWTLEQRQFALQAMFVAATSTGELDAVKLQLLASLKQILQLSDQDYQAAIEAAIDWDIATDD